MDFETYGNGQAQPCAPGVSAPVAPGAYAPIGMQPPGGVPAQAAPYGYQQAPGAVPPPPGYAPQQPQAYTCAPAGYVPAYPYAPVYGYAPAYYAPPFAAGGVPVKNPRRKEASRMLNRMCLLVMGQTAASFLWQFLIGLVLGFSATGLNLLEDSMAMSWLEAALVPLSTALPFFLYMMIGRKDAADYLKFQKTGFGWGLLCVLAGVGLCLLGNYPAFIIQDLLREIGYYTMDSVFGGDSWAAFALDFFTLAVLVPLIEEFAFRGVLLSSLRKYGIGFSIVASALVFGLVHVQLGNVVFATIAGLIMGFVYARTNNLWLTIVIHGINNGLSVLGSYSGLFWGDSWDSNLLSTICFMLIPIGLGLIALVFVLIFRRRLFPPQGSPGYDGPAHPLSGGESALAILRAPMFWGVVGLVAVCTLFFL